MIAIIDDFLCWANLPPLSALLRILIPLHGGGLNNTSFTSTICIFGGVTHRTHYLPSVIQCNLIMTFPLPPKRLRNFWTSIQLVCLTTREHFMLPSVNCYQLSYCNFSGDNFFLSDFHHKKLNFISKILIFFDTLSMQGLTQTDSILL